MRLTDLIEQLELLDRVATAAMCREARDHHEQQFGRFRGEILSHLRTLAAKDAEIADLTRRLAACVELPEIPILGQFVLRDNSEPKRVEFSVELFDDEGELTDFAFGPTPAAAIAALRQKMEQA